MPIRTFVDANVLIAAHRGQEGDRGPALALLGGMDRYFIASPFLWLEVMPKAVYHQNSSEIDFYRLYFETIRLWISDLHSVVRIAAEEAEKCGIAALDALHLAAAHVGEADEFCTLERAESPLYRTSLVRVNRLKTERSDL